MSKPRPFASSFYNPLTYFGAAISIIVLIAEVFLFAVDFLSGKGNLYLGLLTYLALPAVLIVGLLLIVAGAIWKRSRIKRGLEPFDFRRFRIDLTISTHRNAVLVFIVGSAVLLMMTMVGTYQAYEYTESVEFCGELCHKVMHPEHTAYQNSPHGKVMCVDCHIGPGAQWFVKAKLSGLRQVYHAILGDYSRPIKTPIENLRPAQDTCLECHFPGKFFGSVELRRTYFLADQDNLPWHVRMLLRLGAGTGHKGGVHAHMNFQNDIFYAAEDERREKISWIKTTNAEGKEVIYTTKQSIFKDTPPTADKIRKMDCLDCHNRPTHQMGTPDRLINEAMLSGDIDPKIPDVKAEAVKLMASEDYKSNEEALEKIRNSFVEYYKSEHADYYKEHTESIDKAVLAIQKAFSANIFPSMKARWDSFPDNIGHLSSKGCFRCHDGKHRNEEGKVITRDCNACHTIIEQGPEGKLERDIEGLEFQHPDGEEDWKTKQCVDCHSGAGV